MFQHPKQWLTPPPDDASIQPNAVDIRVDRIFRFLPPELAGDHVMILDSPGLKEIKKHREVVEMLPRPLPRQAAFDGWELPPGVYPFESHQSVEVPMGMAGWLIPRSTLNRNGVTVTSGLYDSGYNNGIGGLLRVPEGCTLTLAWRSRIAQFLMAEAATSHAYDGDYNKK